MSSLYAVIRRHAAVNKPQLLVVLRIVGHVLALMLAMWGARTYFADADAAELSLFVVFASGIEFAWANRCRGVRYWVAMFCIVAVMVFGSFAAHEALCIQRQSQIIKTLNTRVDGILDDVPGAVFAANEDELIEACSRGVTELTGYSREELIGQSLWKIIPKQYLPNRKLIAQNLRSPDSRGWNVQYLGSLPINRKDGSTVTVTMHLIAVRLSVGRPQPSDVQFLSIAVR